MELHISDMQEGRQVGSVIIHHFAIKSSFFKLLGACRLKKRIFALVLAMTACLSFLGCSSYKNAGSGSKLPERVLASQGVTAGFSFGSLVIINGKNDTLPRVSPLSAGSSPGLMALSPTRNIVATFDANSNTVYAVNTVTESGIGSVRLPGPTASIVLPLASALGYAAVPTATVNGFSVLGSIEVMNFASGSRTSI